MNNEQIKEELYNLADHSLLYTSKQEWNEQVNDYVDNHLPEPENITRENLPELQENFENFIS